MFWESSSSEEDAAIEIIVFWKSGRSKKVALQEKLVFWCSSSEKADAVQKYLLRSKKLFCRCVYSEELLYQKAAIPKSNCPKELPFLIK